MSLCCGWQASSSIHKRYPVTHYKLDARAQIGHDVRVKKFFPRHHTLILLGALALLPACKPQGVNMAELSQLQARNSQLRQEIADMENLIRRAGEVDPTLQDQLESRNKEVVQAYENLKKLKAQETEARMRRIELEGRLEVFRANFQEMQNKIVSSPKSQLP